MALEVRRKRPRREPANAWLQRDFRQVSSGHRTARSAAFRRRRRSHGDLAQRRGRRKAGRHSWSSSPKAGVSSASRAAAVRLKPCFTSAPGNAFGQRSLLRCGGAGFVGLSGRNRDLCFRNTGTVSLFCATARTKSSHVALQVDCRLSPDDYCCAYDRSRASRVWVASSELYKCAAGRQVGVVRQALFQQSLNVRRHVGFGHRSGRDPREPRRRRWTSALSRAYGPESRSLNAQRAGVRATDENVPQRAVGLSARM